MVNCTIEGPPETPYEGGVFRVVLWVSPQFPADPPLARFITRVYHPNIDAEGRICLDTLKLAPSTALSRTGYWSPKLSLSAVLLTLQSLLASPNPEDGLDQSICALYMNNYPQFWANARSFTRKYARRQTEEQLRIDVSSTDSEANRRCSLESESNTVSGAEHLRAKSGNMGTGGGSGEDLMGISTGKAAIDAKPSYMLAQPRTRFLPPTLRMDDHKADGNVNLLSESELSESNASTTSQSTSATSPEIQADVERPAGISPSHTQGFSSPSLQIRSPRGISSRNSATDIAIPSGADPKFQSPSSQCKPFAFQSPNTQLRTGSDSPHPGEHDDITSLLGRKRAVREFVGAENAADVALQLSTRRPTATWTWDSNPRADAEVLEKKFPTLTSAAIALRCEQAAQEEAQQLLAQRDLPARLRGKRILADNTVTVVDKSSPLKPQVGVALLQPSNSFEMGVNGMGLPREAQDNTVEIFPYSYARRRGRESMTSPLPTDESATVAVSPSPDHYTYAMRM